MSSRDFHAFDYGPDGDNPNVIWSACACGWIDGPHATRDEARDAWTDHLRPTLKATS